MNSLIFFAIILAVCPKFGLQGRLYTVNKITYYVELDQQLTWNEAVLECRKRDMYLATFDSVEDFYDLNNQLSANGDNLFVWVGAVGDPITSTYAWVTTGKPIISAMWSYDATNSLGFNCVYAVEYNFFRYYCTFKCGSICRESKPPSCCDKKSNVFLNIKQS